MTTSVFAPGAFAERKVVNSGSTFAPAGAGFTAIIAGLVPTVETKTANATRTVINLVALFIAVSFFKYETVKFLVQRATAAL
jgi:hypothetical protein